MFLESKRIMPLYHSSTEHLLLWIVKVGILAVLVIPLLVSPDTIYPFRVGKALFARAAIEIIFGCWLILILRYPWHRPSHSWVILAFAAWLLVSVITSLTGVSPVRSFWSTYSNNTGVIDLAHWFVYTLIVASIFRSLSDWKLLFSVSLVVCSIISALGIGQHIGLYNIWWIDNSLHSRIASTIGTASHFGAYTLINIIVGIGLLSHSIVNHEKTHHASLLRIFWLIAVILAFCAMWFSATRASFIGLVASIAVFVVLYIIWGKLPNVRRMLPVIAIVLVILLLIIATLFITSRFTNDIHSLLESNLLIERLILLDEHDEEANSVTKRTESIKANFHAYLDKPILGWGPQNYLVAWGRYISAKGIPDEMSFDHAHNKLMEEVVTSGTIGILSYIAIWCAMAWVVVRSLTRRIPNDQLFVLIVAGVFATAYFVQNLFLTDSPSMLMVFSILVAFVATEEIWIAKHDIKNQNIIQPKNYLRITRVSAIIIATFIFSLVFMSIYFISVRPYIASQYVNASLHPQSSVASQEFNLRNAIEVFPSFANTPRVYLWNWMKNNFNILNDRQFEYAMNYMAEQADIAIKIEPENYTLYVELAFMYLEASERDYSYMTIARDYIERYSQLAPNLPYKDKWNEKLNEKFNNIEYSNAITDK